MRDLQFWLDKFNKVARQVGDLKRDIQYKTSASIVGNNLFNRKLKKIRGYGLNNEYTGYKVHRRRKQWLVARNIRLTKIATDKHEVKRLETTKLPFYEKKILELGGTVPERW